MRAQYPSQTVGPFFAFALIREGSNILVNEQTLGERITLKGQVLDGDEVLVDDALVEIWQADARGHFRHPADPLHAQADPHFKGFGRSGSAGQGFVFQTIKPGPVPPSPVPCIAVRVFARGMLIHAVTRVYFSDHDNTQDPVFAQLDPQRRQTLVAQRCELPGGVLYRWNIHLQGEQETIFFDL